MLGPENVDFVAGTCKKMQVHSVLAVFSGQLTPKPKSTGPYNLYKFYLCNKPKISPNRSEMPKILYLLCKWYLYCFDCISINFHPFQMFQGLFLRRHRSRPIPSSFVLALAPLPQSACKKMQMHICNWYIYCFDCISTNSHLF